MALRAAAASPRGRRARSRGPRLAAVARHAPASIRSRTPRPPGRIDVSSCCHPRSVVRPRWRATRPGRAARRWRTWCSASVHAGLAIQRRHRFHRAVGEDRPDRRVESRQQSLCLAERIAVEQRGAAGVGVGAPPGVDLREQCRCRRPAIHRQTEGALGDERVAAHRLPRPCTWGPAPSCSRPTPPRPRRDAPRGPVPSPECGRPDAGRTARRSR
jgi:hypothetical protein